MLHCYIVSQFITMLQGTFFYEYLHHGLEFCELCEYNLHDWITQTSEVDCHLNVDHSMLFCLFLFISSYHYHLYENVATVLILLIFNWVTVRLLMKYLCLLTCTWKLTSLKVTMNNLQRYKANAWSEHHKLKTKMAGTEHAQNNIFHREQLAP